MKWIPDRTGRFRQRPYYEEQELDSECESLVSEFLFERHGKVRWPLETDDLTVLVERLVLDLDLYADLTSLGQEVEGVTYFSSNSRPSVRISQTLSNSDHLVNRLRTTLTHELGHVHFHSCLFDSQDLMSELLGAERRTTVERGGAGSHSHECRRETILDAREVDWMEWQAGYACGAFLMPRSGVKSIVKEFTKSKPRFVPVVDGSEEASRIVDALVGRFVVSTEAARIRLLKLKLVLPAGRGI